MDGQTITGIEVEEDGKNVKYHAPVVIDATPDGNVCAAADVPYTFAGEDIGERDREMGVTLALFKRCGLGQGDGARYENSRRRNRCKGCQWQSCLGLQ